MNSNSKKASQPQHPSCLSSPKSPILWRQVFSSSFSSFYTAATNTAPHSFVFFGKFYYSCLIELNNNKPQHPSCLSSPWIPILWRQVFSSSFSSFYITAAPNTAPLSVLKVVQHEFKFDFLTKVLPFSVWNVRVWINCSFCLMPPPCHITQMNIQKRAETPQD